MLGEPRRPPCWRAPLLIPGLVLLVYSWLLIFSSLLGGCGADEDAVHNQYYYYYNNSAAAAAATAPAAINSSCRAAVARRGRQQYSHRRCSLNASDWAPNPGTGISVSLTLGLEQELGSNPFVKLQPPRVSLSLSLSVFGEMKTNPFGFVIKLPLGQPEAEQPLDDQEHLLKQGASQPHQANAGSSSSSTREWRKCSYTVTIKTSCSSPRVTRDAISLVFGDAYRNEVYAARLDDPASGTFERCSIDTFRVAGPCGDRTCYLYLRRSGRDGWTPEYVKAFYSPSDPRAAVTFFYKVPLPDGVWYGYNLCHGGGVAAPTTPDTTAFNLLDATVGTDDDHPRMTTTTTTTGPETGRPTFID